MHGEHRIVINRPVERIFAYVANVENNPAWQGPIVAAKQTSPGAPGVGTTATTRSKFMGRTMETTTKFTEFEPNVRIVEKTTSGPFPMVFRWRFEPATDGTKVTHSMEAEPRGFFKLIGLLFQKDANRQLAADLRTLKETIERQSA